MAGWAAEAEAAVGLGAPEEDKEGEGSHSVSEFAPRLGYVLLADNPSAA